MFTEGTGAREGDGTAGTGTSFLERICAFLFASPSCREISIGDEGSATGMDPDRERRAASCGDR